MHINLLLLPQERTLCLQRGKDPRVPWPRLWQGPHHA